MINGIAILLLVTTFVTCTVLLPPPPAYQSDADADAAVIVKEGRRVVVVEYDKGGDGHTKVSFPPQPQLQDHVASASERLSAAAAALKDKAKEASSVLPNVGQGISVDPNPDPTGKSRGPGELVCDAFGKCKQKLESALGKTKEKVSDKTQQVEEEISEKAREIGGKTKDVAGKAQQQVEEEISEKAREIGGKTKDVAGKAQQISERAKEIVSEKAQKAKDKANEAVATTKTLGKDIVANVSEMEGKIVEKAKSVKGEIGEKNVSEILGPVVGFVHLFGLGTAYGMNMWVTFFSSYILAEALPRQQFGIMQARLYPVYFKSMAYSIGALLFAHTASKWKGSGPVSVECLQVYNLLISLLLVLVNLRMEPRANKVMYERMKLEKEEGVRVIDAGESGGRGGVSTSNNVTPVKTVEGSSEREREMERVRSRLVELTEKLKKMNYISSLLNMITLISLTWHLTYLSQRLYC